MRKMLENPAFTEQVDKKVRISKIDCLCYYPDSALPVVCSLYYNQYMTWPIQKSGVCVYVFVEGRSNVGYKDTCSTVQFVAAKPAVV